MTEKRPIVLFGTGGMASIVRLVLDHESAYQVFAYTADRDHIRQGSVDGLEVIPFDEVATRLPPSDFAMFVAVGYSRMNAVRAARRTQAQEMGYELISHISNRASTWADLRIGPNTIVMEDCTIGLGVSIGAGCIIWPRCYIGHGVVVGDDCYLAANASISGLSVVGRRCVLGTASVIRDRTTVGEASVVGAGVVLQRDLDPLSVVAAPHPRYIAGASERLPDL